LTFLSGFSVLLATYDLFLGANKHGWMDKYNDDDEKQTREEFNVVSTSRCQDYYSLKNKHE